MSQTDPPVPPEPPAGPGGSPEVTSPPPGEAQPAGSEFAEFFHTEDLPEKPPPVSHRGAIEASPAMQRLLAPATAIAVVVVVILLLIWINGGSSGTNQSPAAVGPGPATTAAPVVPASHHPKPAGTTAAPTTDPTATAKPPVGTAPTTRTRRASAVATAPVTVLNNSRRTGLAAAVAAELRGRKWQVAAVGNQTQVIPVTTVYYPAGERAAAVHLAHDFSSVQRIAPAGAAARHGSGLTLVVTQSWVL